MVFVEKVRFSQEIHWTFRKRARQWI